MFKFARIKKFSKMLLNSSVVISIFFTRTDAESFVLKLFSYTGFVKALWPHG